jgi:hypothetical protein
MPMVGDKNRQIYLVKQKITYLSKTLAEKEEYC